MNRAETGQLFDDIIDYYPAFESRVRLDPERLIDKWQETLATTPYDHAYSQLKKYASLPENKFAPHPGALAKVKTEADRYFEAQQAAGAMTVGQWEEMKAKAVGPSEAQRRKVEELRGRTV